MIISINGIDDVGKSQQIKLLQFYNGENLIFTKPLIEYSQKWPKLKGHDMFNWWFHEVGIDEFVDIVIESLNARNSMIRNKVMILDRGTLMFKAVCSATISIRTGCALIDSIDKVDTLFAQGLSYRQEDERNVLLLPNEQYQESIAPYIALLRSGSDDFTKEDNEFYLYYQKLLKEAVNFYFNGKEVCRIVVNDSICEIQNKLRKLIGDISKLPLPEICNGVQQIVGFGGLSECGKSSFADHLRKNKEYYRLKLGYFVEILKRHRLKDTPENIAMEFLHFCKVHYYIERFTLESLHEPYTPAYLKLLFGAKFKIVYLNAPFRARSNRASIEQGISLPKAEDETRRKDRIKKERGAKIVGEIADFNFNNSGGSYEDNILKFEKAIIS